MLVQGPFRMRRLHRSLEAAGLGHIEMLVHGTPEDSDRDKASAVEFRVKPRDRAALEAALATYRSVGHSTPTDHGARVARLKGALQRPDLDPLLRDIITAVLAQMGDRDA